MKKSPKFSFGYKIIIVLFLCFIVFSTGYAIEIPSIYSKNAILIDNDSGKILFEKGGNEKVYPASTTKVLTAILVLENLDMSSSTVVTKTAINLPYGSSNAALKQGEVMKIEDLMYAMLLKSGNDCANALAEAVSGSIDNFVVLMNKKLEEIGCTNSHFANAHGYHDANHYTTPVDMMKILSYAMQNEKFVEITSTPSYVIEATNKTPQKREYQNTNRLILTKNDSYLSRYYEYCTGGKTGYTDEAGRTLVAYGTKGDKNLILGIFNGPTSGSDDIRYTDAINLFEYGYNNFDKTAVAIKEDYSFSYKNKENRLIYNYSIPENIMTLSTIDDNNNLTIIDYKIDLDYDKINSYNINSEDYKNQVIGKININFRQNSSNYSKEYDLVLNNIEKMPLLSTPSKHAKNMVLKITILILAILVVYILVKIKVKKSSKRKKSKSINSRRARLNTTSSINNTRDLNYRSRRNR